MASEKRPQHHHNFKAGAMNALIRVSSQISNSPIILNMDCDMYSNNSNNSQSIRDALCFSLDEDKGNDIGYVQYSLYFVNCGKNDLYANAFNVNNDASPGFQICSSSRKMVSDSELKSVEWITREGHYMPAPDASTEERAYLEENTAKTIRRIGREEFREKMRKVLIHWKREQRLWLLALTSTTHFGVKRQIGLKYGCAVEDVITGLAIQCRRWKSIYFNPARKAFLGMAPTSLAQSLMQHKRWSEGNFNIFPSKYCPFLYGHGKIKIALQMVYSIYGLWASNSIPTLYYLTIPSLCLLKRIPLFPRPRVRTVCIRDHFEDCIQLSSHSAAVIRSKVGGIHS